MPAFATKGCRLSEPRISPRPTADWDADVRDALAALRPPESARRPSEPRRERPSSNILGIFSWHPALAKAFFTFNNHLFRSTLSARDREMATVRVAGCGPGGTSGRRPGARAKPGAWPAKRAPASPPAPIPRSGGRATVMTG